MENYKFDYKDKNYGKSESEQDEFLGIIAYVFYRQEFYWTVEKCIKLLKEKKIPIFEIQEEKDYVRIFVKEEKDRYTEDENTYIRFEYITEDTCANTVYKKVMNT